MKLSDLKNGDSAVIVKVLGHGGFRKRIMEMGFVRGQKVTRIMDSPMHDPVKYTVMGYDVSLRRSEASLIEVLSPEEAESRLDPIPTFGCRSGCGSCANATDCPICNTMSSKRIKTRVLRSKIINVALVGNPNSGKTSLFNALSGGSEHVGNYSGVTVDAKTGHFNYKGYHINLTDLPGTYSLSAYSPEEIYVRRHLLEKIPDVIINTVVASNLERNLYLTTELIDLSQRTVVALNMYDELTASAAKLDYKALGGMMGIPMVPTVAKSGKGLGELLDTVIDRFEGRDTQARHVHIPYGPVLEPEITGLAQLMHKTEDYPQQFPARYWALKMIEGDREVSNILADCERFNIWKTEADKAARRIAQSLDQDVETAVSDAKYGFIDGALTETFVEGTVDTGKKTRRIDKLVANKWLGIPIFILLMWLMFALTFNLGAYPQAWIEMGFNALGDLLGAWIPDGAFRNLIVNGIIAGVGSVAVFLPNILILYLFISLMEDSGYMARAAFIMDRLMHRMGLHGKSFIPMIMGFGCNVPAIMATRTIESRSSRLITILITPFMSCSARLPIYILLAGAFFPHHAATLLICLYLLGILVAVGTSRLMRRVHFGPDETPFVMELPPYRWPTLRATLKHMWDKCAQYLKKIGTIVLLSTIVIWALSYYPTSKQGYEDSYLGKIGVAVTPAMKPLGLGWRETVALVSSIPAKELVVSTLGVLYPSEDGEKGLKETLAHTMTPRSALAFLVFILLFFPCIATIATIAHETGKRRWAYFAVFYNTAVAWIAGWLVYRLSAFVL